MPLLSPLLDVLAIIVNYVCMCYSFISSSWQEIRSKSSAELDSLKQEVATLKQFMVEVGWDGCPSIKIVWCQFFLYC